MYKDKGSNSKRDLLIIGNGFDLSLGLKSSFKDYMNINTFNSKIYQELNDFINSYTNAECKMAKKLKSICLETKTRIKPLYKKDSYGDFLTNKISINNNDNLKFNKDGIYISYGGGSRFIPKGLILRNKRGQLFMKQYKYLTRDDIANNYFIINLFINSTYMSYKMTTNLFCCQFNWQRISSASLRNKLVHKLINLNNWASARVKVLDKEAHKIRTNRNYYKINFWTLLMLLDMNIDNENNLLSNNSWADVENTIKEFLISIINFKHYPLQKFLLKTNDTSDSHFKFFTKISRYLDILKNVDDIMKKQRIFSEVADVYDLHSKIYRQYNYDDFCLNDKCKYNFLVYPTIFLVLSVLKYYPQGAYNPEFYTYDTNNNNKSLFVFLTNQLKQFDNDFSSYLKRQVTGDYIKRSLLQLKRLSVNNNLQPNLNNFSVLDFNYTPLSSSIKHYEHIHGSLKNGHIVIGIGEQTVNRLKPKISNQMYNYLYSFTKTYQLFSFNKRTDNEFLNNVKNIVFFGHSFGVNDFPYFEALFDHFKIYSNHHINLIFAYCGHGDTSYEEAKMKLVPRIVSLLKDYSRSLSQAHSDNLIAKMFMENRIKLYPVHFGK